MAIYRLIRRCTICDLGIRVARLRLHPNAATCGGDCQTEHWKRVHREHALHSQRRRRADGRR